MTARRRWTRRRVAHSRLLREDAAVLTVKQAATRLGVSPSLVYAWCEEHMLPHYRMGGKGKRGKILIEESALDAFLQGCKVEAGASHCPPLRHITLR
jgi:excisionase family DNA binding protein